MPAPPELLDSVPLFGGLSRREREQIAHSMKGRSLDAGETLAVEGERGVGFFVIQSGTARVSVGGEERRMLGPGDYFGEIALISQANRSATVSAETPLQVWGLTSWEFRPIVENNATVAWSLLEALAKMISDSSTS
jgi:CRP-like cAMP-binding protein